MNCEIYYTLKGKQMYCETDSKAEFGLVAMNFHAFMQNEVKKVPYETQVNGKKVKKTRNEPSERFNPEDYRIVCIKRYGIVADQFAKMNSCLSSMDNAKKIANLHKKFSEESARKFPSRVHSVMEEAGI